MAGWRWDDMAIEDIIKEKQEEYEQKRLEKVEAYKRDQELTEYAQTRWEYHKALGNDKRADFYDWVLELVDRLEEAEYHQETLTEEVLSHEEYIRELELEVGNNTWKDTWYKR